MRRSHKPIILCTMIGLVAVIALFFVQIHNSPLSYQKLHEQLLTCDATQAQKTYDCMYPYIEKTLTHLPSEPFLRYVSEQKDLSTKNQCHTIGHVVGHFLYASKKSAMVALRGCSPVCASGCTMGVMEAFMQVDSGTHVTKKAFLKKADEVCQAYARAATSSNSAYSTELNQCMHSVGHSIAIVFDKPYTELLALCDTTSPMAQTSCYYGVSMEMILPTNRGKSTIHHTTDPVQTAVLCSPLHDSAKIVACMHYIPYAWRERSIPIQESITLCDKASHREACVHSHVTMTLDDYMAKGDHTIFDLLPLLTAKDLKSSITHATHLLGMKPGSHDYVCDMVPQSEKQYCVAKLHQQKEFFSHTTP